MFARAVGAAEGAKAVATTAATEVRTHATAAVSPAPGAAAAAPSAQPPPHVEQQPPPAQPYANMPTAVAVAPTLAQPPPRHAASDMDSAAAAEAVIVAPPPALAPTVQPQPQKQQQQQQQQRGGGESSLRRRRRTPDRLDSLLSLLRFVKATTATLKTFVCGTAVVCICLALLLVAILVPVGATLDARPRMPPDSPGAGIAAWIVLGAVIVFALLAIGALIYVWTQLNAIYEPVAVLKRVVGGADKLRSGEATAAAVEAARRQAKAAYDKIFELLLVEARDSVLLPVVLAGAFGALVMIAGAIVAGVFGVDTLPGAYYTGVAFAVLGAVVLLVTLCMAACIVPVYIGVKGKIREQTDQLWRPIDERLTAQLTVVGDRAQAHVDRGAQTAGVGTGRRTRQTSSRLPGEASSGRSRKPSRRSRPPSTAL